MICNFNEEKKLIIRLIQNFSAYKNSKNLFKFKNEELSCLHGVRFLTLAWYLIN